MKSKRILLTIACVAFQTIECSEGLNINVQDPFNFNNTLLHKAVEQDDLPLTQNLLDQGADPNIQNEAGDTPLHIAISDNNRQITQLLLDHHANPNIQNRKGNTSLHSAAIASNNLEDFPFVEQYHPEIVHSLLQAGANSIATNRNNQVAATIAGNQNIKLPIQIDAERRVLNHLVPQDLTRHILSYSYE